MIYKLICKLIYNPITYTLSDNYEKKEKKKSIKLVHGPALEQLFY
jgi:hypothetical protein